MIMENGNRFEDEIFFPVNFSDDPIDDCEFVNLYNLEDIKEELEYEAAFDDDFIIEPKREYPINKVDVDIGKTNYNSKNRTVEKKKGNSTRSRIADK